MIQIKELSTIANETVRLDGTKYMRFQNNADFNISGSFTVSLWENLSSINGTYPSLFSLSSPPIQSLMYAGLLFGYHHSGIRYVYASSNGTSWDQIYAFNLGAPDYGVWVHWEVGYDEPTKKLYLFKNGTLLNTFTLTANLYNDPAKNAYIGEPYNTGYINALVADFNFTAGICIHKSNFTPASIGSTAPTKVLSPLFTDAVTKFGEGSGVSYGTGYLSTAVDSFTLDTVNDFTVSFWEYFVSGIDNSASFAVNAGSANGVVVSALLIGYNYGGYKYFYASTGKSGQTTWDIAGVVPITTQAEVANRWAHWEVGYKSSTKTLYVFLDGVLKYSVLCSSPLRMSSPSYTHTGMWASGSQSAYYDEIMILQGECLHTASFTPPTEPYDYQIVDPFPGIHFGETEIGERSSVKQGFEFGDLSAEGQLTRQIRRAIRVEQLEGVGTLSRPVRAARRIEQLMGFGNRTQGNKKLNDEFLGEFFDLGPRSAERSGTDLESLDTGNREIAYRVGIDSFLLESADRETPNRNGFDIESFDFDSNAVNKFNLTVTPTHQYKSRIVEIKADLLDQTPSFGQYSLSINGDDVVPFSSIDDRINTILVNVSPDKFITGNNLCRLRILRQNGDKEHLDFEVFKEEPKRTQVERLFRSYEGGYDGERMNAGVSLSAYPSFMPPRDQSSTLIKTTEFTRIPLAKYLAVQGVNIDAKGARIAVSFDEGQTWKTWGIVGRGSLNTSKSIIATLFMDNMGDYVANASSRTGSNAWQPYRVFDGLTNAAGGSNFWLASSAAFPHWVSIRMPKKRRVNGYTMIGYYQPDRNPKAWRFEGSNNGTTWDVLDSRSGQTLSLTVKSYYSFENTNEYLYYRIVVTELAGGPTASCVIVEMDLFELTPIYGWVDADLENIAEKGMTPEIINSRTLADWSTIFKAKSIDFAVYLDDRLSTYYDLSLYPAELLTSISYNGFQPSFQIKPIPADKIVTTTYLQRWNNESAGTYGRAIYADYTQMIATPSNSVDREFPVTPSKDVKYISLETPDVTGVSYAVMANYRAWGTRRIAYLKSINVQITPNPKTGYAFII